MKGSHGWLLLAGVVCAWDLLVDDSLSAAFKRGNPKVTALAVSVTTAHLYGLLPKKADPFYVLLHLARK